MKLWLVLCFASLVYCQSGESVEDELPLAEFCDPETCHLPDCRCSSTEIPGGLHRRDTPQMVHVTFDDAVNTINIETYRSLLTNRRNKNGCPAEATFYVNHEYTNYQLVNELYNQGHEIALHSISHQTPQTYWQQATYEQMWQEFGDQKQQMAHFANIPLNELRGIRIPFLQMTGNASFQVLASANLLYDCSWSTSTFTDPGLWPYTLHHASTQDCPVPPCPTASIPGPWVKPMISWIDEGGVACAMVDACFNVPPHNDEDAWFNFIVRNFERHYLGNRAPFGFYVHEWYLSIYPAVYRALERFLDVINEIEDVYMVKSYKAVEWSRNPTTIPEFSSSEVGRCSTHEFRICSVTTCGPLTAQHNSLDYWMTSCQPCPVRYPWLGNPLGLNI